MSTKIQFSNGQSEAERKAEDLRQSIEGRFRNKVKETREKVVTFSRKLQ